MLGFLEDITVDKVLGANGKSIVVVAEDITLGFDQGIEGTAEVEFVVKMGDFENIEGDNILGTIDG